MIDRRLLTLTVASFLSTVAVEAFSPSHGAASSFGLSQRLQSTNPGQFSSTTLFAQDISELRNLLLDSYPEFNALIDKNEALWKKISESEDGFTVFAPSSAAFASLGAKKLEQLEDARNLETVLKVGEYHFIAETVSFEKHV